MLTQLQIRDFAIVNELSLDLSGGLIALTGETGAGKSILVDALGLVLGDRANSSTIRHGTERAEISAHFDISQESQARAWLADQGLETADCLIRRVINRDGKNRAWINGSPVTLQSLKTLGEMLVDIHGQHAHQSLLRREVQRCILDDYADHPPLLAAMAQAHDVWRKAARRLAEITEQRETREARRELLRFQTAELQALNLTAGELEHIEQEHARLAHAGRLLETTEAAYHGLYAADHSAESVVGRCLSDIEHLQSLDPRLTEPRELLAAAQIQLREAADWLRYYADGLEMDPARLDFLESRLAAIQSLARKHRVPPADLPHLLHTLEAELHQLETDDENLEALADTVACALETCRHRAAALSEARCQAATRLSEAVTQAMQGLGMEGGHFVCTVAADARAQPSAHGTDRVEFLVSANPGQPAQPLARVASGGELSRISLAIQMIAAHALPIATLVFDEVDTGIGGGVAEVVGRQLRSLGERRQVLCVTHLPQVAAQAHHHLRIKKRKERRYTSTSIEQLSNEQRARELARMLGGLEITEQSLAHAREMMARAASR
ncbi:DNA repair protein RecN (Recombination protein N) [Ectothiorhodospira magna]|uniref:DNA repair protein RecN n=1 Tax=Ectothiorhodospira magna TaxID=867345 RepID=A0A1H9B0V5_9GAMM|nr:DNA repair protein RecN [Ectothiorhodospira magna]SEP82489.1 DNA repair protein RecN (Recombination protein N) [Ectothiorhodospira magna]